MTVPSATPGRRWLLLTLAVCVCLAGVAAWHSLRWHGRVPKPPADVTLPTLRDDLAAARARAVQWWHPRQFEGLRELALLYHANGQHEAALALYAMLAKREPANADWPELIADLALQRGDAAAARTALTRAVTADPGRASAWALLGELYYKAGETGEAGRAWENAVRAEPHAAAQLGLARLAADRGDRRAAIALLQEAVKADPALGAAHALLASLLAAEGHTRRAAVVAALANKYASVPEKPSRVLAEVARRTREVDRLAVLADVALLRDEPAAALAWARRAVATDPQAWRAWLAMGFVHERLGELPEARRGYERALALGGDRVTLVLELAAVARRAGELDTARARLLEAEKLGVSRSRIRHALGEIEAAAGNPALAEQRFRESLEEDPSAIASVRSLARVLWETGRGAEAVPLLERVRAADPLDFASRAALGEELARRGDHAAAVPLFREAVDLAPENQALRDLGAKSALVLTQQLARERQLDAAVDHARTAVEFVPDRFEPLAVFATLASSADRIDEAVTLAEAYAARQPRDAKGWLLLGDLRLLQRQPEAARVAWEKARDAAPAQPALKAEIARRLGSGSNVPAK